MGSSSKGRNYLQHANYVRRLPGGGILMNKCSRVLGFKGSRVDYFILNIFTGTLEPLNPWTLISVVFKRSRCHRILGIPYI
jgi:hypothetical protein